MIRLVFLVVAIALVAFGAAWVADQPGEATLTIAGHHIAMPPIVLATALLCTLIVLWAVIALIRFVWTSPARAAAALRSRSARKGREAIERGIIAAGSGDLRAASRYAADAERLAADQPLTLLLKAQASQLAGDRDGAEKAFRAMADKPETKVLGLRGLYVEAQRRQDRDALKAIAEEAVKAAPGAGWAAQALLDHHVTSSNWDAALASVERQISSRVLDRETGKRHRAVLLTAKGLEREVTDPDDAARCATEAVGLAPTLVPAAALAARLLAQRGDVRKATKIVEAAWSAQPHPDLADAYAKLRSGESAVERLKRVRGLAERKSGDVEGALALARAAIDASEFATAEAALTPHLAERPSQRLCLMMAELAAKGANDYGRAREWMARALRAPRDPAWVADGQISDQWRPVSPVGGRIDAYEWKVPALEIGGPVLHVDDMLADIAEGAVPVIDAKAEDLSADVMPTGPGAEPALEAGTAGAPPVPVMTEPEIRLPPPPDDPGLRPADRDRKKRFRLFG